jgi:hypothetical protein
MKKVVREMGEGIGKGASLSVYSQVPNKRVYSFIPNERVGLLF